VGCDRALIPSRSFLTEPKVEVRIYSDTKCNSDEHVGWLETLQAERASALLHNIITLFDDVESRFQNGMYKL
jgi:hypothetical protein